MSGSRQHAFAYYLTALPSQAAHAAGPRPLCTAAPAHSLQPCLPLTPAATSPSWAPACCRSCMLQLFYLLTLPGLPSTPSLHSNIAFLGSGLLVANYVGAIAAALRFPALFNIWTMGAGHAVLAVRRRGRRVFRWWGLRGRVHDQGYLQCTLCWLGLLAATAWLQHSNLLLAEGNQPTTEPHATAFNRTRRWC